MKPAQLVPHFKKMGAQLDLVVSPVPRFVWEPAPFQLDILEGGKNERYLLNITEGFESRIEFEVLDLQRDLRHLVLMARQPDRDGNLSKEKFLCGHDERHWFVAGLPDMQGPATVLNAMEALKPGAARQSQRKNGVRQKNRNRRKNAGFVRQGEWFFIPAPDFVPGKMDICLRNEPLMRGSGSKPHIMEELVRFGGEDVFRHRFTGKVLTAARYAQQLKTRQIKSEVHWEPMKANPDVFVRGKISHADHATLHLRNWHKVVMNQEPVTTSVAFLD